MKASIVDLRYKMKDVLKALDRNEEVSVLYHGKVKGTIIPRKAVGAKKVVDHPFFGMLAGKGDESPLALLQAMRGGRYNDY